MRPPADPPPGLNPVPMKGAILLLTVSEVTAGVRRGKWWRRRVGAVPGLVGVWVMRRAGV
jgi:hypothetical protein